MLVAIDQGTTSTRAMAFRPDLSVVTAAQEEFPQAYPQSGWVEHNPDDLWRTTLSCLRAATAGIAPAGIAGIGIANQRETTVVWDKATGAAAYPAIVWQDRRTASVCDRLKREGAEPLVAARTGLLLDPYFSATKIAWILDRDPALRAKADAGRLLTGTVDTYLTWRLTGGARHVTDATNASRTALYNIHTGDWDDELLRLFRVPRAMLPEVLDCAAEFGVTTPDILGAPVPIRGIAGDQQAAAVGQGCFQPGMMKSTYGTGCFALLNTGTHAVASRNRLLTTVACQLAGQRTYALEGAIFVAGAAVQWLRDGLGIIKHAAETEALAAGADPTQHVYLVPSFVGLAAPWWRPDVRGALFGLTRNTGPKELARAALESVAYQTADLLDAMRMDMQAGGGGEPQTVLRVDGGMAASDWTMQRLADILDAPVDRPKVLETTALGAAYLAGLQAGVCPAPAEFGKTWSLDRRFSPAMSAEERGVKRAGWDDAIGRLLEPGV
jgi:glycerol kinase